MLRTTTLVDFLNYSPLVSTLYFNVFCFKKMVFGWYSEQLVHYVFSFGNNISSSILGFLNCMMTSILERGKWPSVTHNFTNWLISIHLKTPCKGSIQQGGLFYSPPHLMFEYNKVFLFNNNPKKKKNQKPKTTSKPFCNRIIQFYYNWKFPKKIVTLWIPKSYIALLILN